ncbi:MAG TPA: hypothetical protein VEL28_04430 [Candidatus Binatia bacterium]|nr:hypothetical protein [Candidatus Binatia bacterium]
MDWLRRHGRWTAGLVVPVVTWAVKTFYPDAIVQVVDWLWTGRAREFLESPWGQQQIDMWTAALCVLILAVAFLPELVAVPDRIKAYLQRADSPPPAPSSGVTKTTLAGSAASEASALRRDIEMWLAESLEGRARHTGDPGNYERTCAQAARLRFADRVSGVVTHAEVFYYAAGEMIAELLRERVRNARDFNAFTELVDSLGALASVFSGYTTTEDFLQHEERRGRLRRIS